MKNTAADSAYFVHGEQETLLAFAVLTPAVYLNMTRHLQHVLPVTCHVLTEKRFALQYRRDCTESTSLEVVEAAVNYLSQISNPDQVENENAE